MPTIDGRAQLKIPPGTQSGQKLRMRERGVENAARPEQRGDQIVTVEVVVPTELTDEQKTALESLAAVTDPAPRIAVDG